MKLLTRTKRQANRNVEPEAKWSFFNLTGDTIDLDVPSVTEETVDETEEIAYTTEDIFVEEPVTPRRSWRRRKSTPTSVISMILLGNGVQLLVRNRNDLLSYLG